MEKPESTHILIVEDDIVNLQIISSILTGKGYTVATAENGNEALSFLEKETTDLILLDVMMPGITGLETCRQIKQHKKLEHIPIIFLTAKSETDDMLAGFNAGGVDYITKPFQEKVLMARIKTHLELKSSRESVIRQAAELQDKNKELKEAGEIIKRKNDELEKAMKQLEETVRTDYLTGLFNRRHISDMFSHERSRTERNGRTFSIIISDIDNFKNINDSYGHQYGDYVLKTIAAVMNSSIRDQDTLARWGGEEFILLLPETESNGAVVVAEKLRAAVSSYNFNNSGTQIKATMTFGISLFAKGSDIDTVIQEADQALYRGKTEGKNCVVQH